MPTESILSYSFGVYLNKTAEFRGQIRKLIFRHLLFSMNKIQHHMAEFVRDSWIEFKKWLHAFFASAGWLNWIPCYNSKLV